MASKTVRVTGPWRPKPPEYIVWKAARERCHNPNSRSYANYGGRGIVMCDRWRESFDNFLADMGPRPPGLSLDRTDNNGPYAPDNCAWRSASDQQNNKRNSRRITIDGVTRSLTEWTRLHGVTLNAAYGRLRKGWAPARAVSEPVDRRRHRLAPRPVSADKRRAYKSWGGARARCFNPKTASYPRYGGRGITMAPEWRDSFARFFADMGPCPPNHSLERISVDGHYEMSNCRWATQREQANNRSNNRRLAFRGESHTIAEWADLVGITFKSLHTRLTRGWSIDKVLGPLLRHRLALTHDGRTQFLHEWAREMRMRPATLAQRLEYGWDPATALSTPPHGRPRHLGNHNHLLTIDGVTCTVTEWGRRAGLNAQTIHERLKRGATPDHAVHDPVLPPPTVTINGETHSIPEWAAISGLSAKLLHGRVAKQWPSDRLLDPVTTPRLLTCNGKTQTLRAWAKDLNIHPGALVVRFRRGWTLERALTTVVP